jgi:hypothetical protein
MTLKKSNLKLIFVLFFGLNSYAFDSTHSALVIQDVPIECINQAAVTYYVPAIVIISVLQTEGGRVGMAKLNNNGTYDYGPMQINSIWLRKIEPYGFTREKIQYDACANVMVGTWILSQEIADNQSTWEGVGDYHSHSFQLNQNYQGKVKNIYQKLANYLSNAEKTNDKKPKSDLK